LQVHKELQQQDAQHAAHTADMQTVANEWRKQVTLFEFNAKSLRQSK
jgi:hypothetical protein